MALHPGERTIFRGLWEAAIKSYDITSSASRETYGSCTRNYTVATILAQIKACLNSRPLAPLPEAEDGLEVLTHGHFLIGGPLEALPDPPSLLYPISLLRRWSDEYLTQIHQFSKWNRPYPNLKTGDIVYVGGERLSPIKWPLAHIIEVEPGKDGRVCVVTVKTSEATYIRPNTKIIPLLEGSKSD